MNPTSPKRNGTLIILVSLAFAAAMLLTSFFMADSPHRETVVFLLIAVWWIPFTYLSARSAPRCRSRCKELVSTED